jgi:hypothetical protein
MQGDVTVRTHAMLVALVAAGAPACFYVEPVNAPPSAEITDTDPQPIRAGDTVHLSASKSEDPDGDPLSYDWDARTCDPVDVDRCTEAFAFSSLQLFEFQLPTGRQPVRVELTVTDLHGATGDTSTILFPANRVAIITLQDQGPRSPAGNYTVGRDLTFIATVEGPGPGA